MGGAFIMSATERAESNFKYRAFISYSSHDRRAATWLHRALEGYRVPAPLVGVIGRNGPIQKQIFPVFRDRDELASSSNLSESIREALAQSACLIVVCSPAAAKSSWVNQEILEFKRLGRADHIYALIVDGQPGSESECMPAALRFSLGPDNELDFKAPTEPLAADMRADGDGKRNSLLKLIAGVIGVSLNDLRHRERVAARRRARIRRAIAAAIAVLAAGAGIATWAAWLFRDESEARQVPGVRVVRRQTILDLSGWHETTEADLRNKIHKSLAVSTNQFKVVRTHDHADKFIHIAGTSSATPPEVNCVGCRLVARKHTSASRAPFEWNIEFDISDKPLDKSFDIEFKFIFWNAFQLPEQWWGGYRILHATNVSLYTVQFPGSRHPLPDTIRYYYADTTEHDYSEKPNTTLTKDTEGRVAELTWEVQSPDADRSYRVRWDWSK